MIKVSHIGVCFPEYDTNGIRKKWCPVNGYTVRKIARSKGLDKFQTEMLEKRLLTAYVNNYRIKTDTAVIFPFRSVDEANGNTFEKFFRDAVNLIKNENGEHPVMAYWEEFADFTKMKAANMKEMAPFFRDWLLQNDGIKYVLCPSPSFAKKVFDNSVPKIETAFKKVALKPFEVSIGNRYFTLMFIPSPKQLSQLEDKGWQFTSEIFSMIDKFQDFTMPPIHELTTVAELEKAMSEVDNLEWAIDTETTGLNPHYYDQHILCAGFSDGIQSWVFMIDHPDYPSAEGMAMLKRLISEERATYIFQNGKFDLKWLMKFAGMTPRGKLRDTLLIDHYLHESYGSLGQKLKMGLLAMDSQIPRYLHVASHKGELEPYFNGAIGIKRMIEEAEFCEEEDDLKLTKKEKEQIMEENKIQVLNRLDFPKADTLTIKDVREWITTVTNDMIEPNSGAYRFLPRDLLLKYLGLDLYFTKNIYSKEMERVLEENNGVLPDVIANLHEKQMRSLSEMEYNGFPVMYERVIENIKKASLIAGEARECVLEHLGEDFDINSTAKLRDELLRRGFTIEELTDPYKGKIILDEDHLKKFKKREPWIPDLIRYKKALKARNTYLIPFIYQSYKGFVYYNLNIHGTATGRLSSNNPNFQNIPKYLLKGEDKILVKGVLGIGPDTGYIMFDQDLATAEVKVLTAYVPDPDLISAIKEGKDLHCYTASIVFKKPYQDYISAKDKSDDEEAKKTMTEDDWKMVSERGMAKRGTFGIVYGIGPKGLSKQLNLPDSMSMADKEATAAVVLEKIMKEAYPMLNTVMDEIPGKVMDDGYARTYFGRRRRFYYTMAWEVGKLYHSLPEKTRDFLKDSRSDLISNRRAIRQYLNSQVQSTSSDYLQEMIYKLTELAPKEMDLTLFVTVHDSIVGKVKEYPGVKEDLNRLFNTVVNEITNQEHPELPVNIGFGCDFSYYYCA